MSAAAGQERRDIAPDRSEPEDDQSTFWVWFALGVLIFCWAAEASMCAQRGF